MKRLIDAYELQEYVRGNAAFFTKTPSETIDFVEFAIKAQKTVIYVSDDVKNIVPADKRGMWSEGMCFTEHGVHMAVYTCTNCGHSIERERGIVPPYCELCGSENGRGK